MKKIILIMTLVISAAGYSATGNSIRACSAVKFTDISDTRRCINSGASGEVVNSCAQAFSEHADIIWCTNSGAESDTITACADTNFNEMSNLRRCIRSKARGETIEACREAFTSPADIIRCSRS